MLHRSAAPNHRTFRAPGRSSPPFSLNAQRASLPAGVLGLATLIVLALTTLGCAANATRSSKAGASASKPVTGWLYWRGPEQNGTSGETGLASKWEVGGVNHLWTYDIAGRGTPDQGPAHALMRENPALFDALMERIEAATIEYLSAQVAAGAETVKIFDSWAGSLSGDAFDRYSLAPARRITAALKDRHPGLPVIAFPRGAGARYEGAHAATGAECIALDDGVTPDWAAAHVQKDGCVQGNLASSHMVTGGQALVDETRAILRAFSGGPHIFNLGHGITPDADPANVQLMIDTVRETVTA